uniref:Alkylated DNA repair protein AlkB homologue 8 N-terminal domain-containing protein n=1 Tax=Astatotilapia calliptera TaxID=8154 RepID=A0AAX7SUI1_ASTCA
MRDDLISSCQHCSHIIIINVVPGSTLQVTNHLLVTSFLCDFEIPAFDYFEIQVKKRKTAACPPNLKSIRLSAEFEVNLGYFPLINETVTPSQCQKNIFQMYEKLIGACLENGSHWTLFVSCIDFALSLVHDTFQCPSLGILKAQAYLSWGNHITSVVRKAQQRLYYLRRLRSAHIPRSLMLNFYNCAISSVLTYGFLVWFPSCTKADQQALQRVVKEAGRIIGTSLPEISNIFPTRCLRRVHSILRDQHHLARHLFHLLPSGRRYRSIQARTSRLANSLYPQAVRLLNSLPPSHGQ